MLKIIDYYYNIMDKKDFNKRCQIFVEKFSVCRKIFEKYSSYLLCYLNFLNLLYNIYT